jgi:hypothetical protein
MKNKFVAALSILAIFAFAVAAFAYTQNTNSIADKPSCCKSKDSGPMKAKSHDGHDSNSEHAKMSCCKKHDGQHAEAKTRDCCGDSCPMKKSQGTSATAASATEGKDCCDDCDCCKGKKETSV